MNKARLPEIGFDSYDSMEGLIAIDSSGPPRRFESWPGAKLIHAVYPGLLVAGTIALASTWLAQHYTAPVMRLRSCSAWRSTSCMRKGDVSPASNSPRVPCCA